MAGFDLKEGEYKPEIVSDEELWRAFNMVFSTKTVNSSSYKFVFLKSIIDCIDRAERKDTFSFDEIFGQFTKIYWILVVNYGLSQSKSTTTETYLEQILHEYVGCTTDKKTAKISFDDLTVNAKNKIIMQVKRKCKTYVVGALYEDTKQLLYAFSKKGEWVTINPQMKVFLKQHKSSIEELNYYELAKFLDKVNSIEAVEIIVDERGYSKDKEPVEVFRQLLFDEFEENRSIENVTTNTIELLMVAEESAYNSEKIEKENECLKELYNKEKSVEYDSDSMMMYLDEPERIIKMIKIIKGIRC